MISRSFYKRNSFTINYANTTSSVQNPTTQFNGGGISIIDGKTISLVKGSTNQANNENLNATGQKGVVWSWKAGGSKGTFNVDDVGYANASDVNMAVGDLNSVSFDKSQNWTSQVSGTQNGTYPFSNMFNADGEATHAYPANGTRATFTPSPSFSNAKTVKVWYYGPTINANTFQLNGVNVGDQMPTTSGTLTKTFNVDGFTSWSWSKGIGGDDAGMLRIDVDGVQLVDSGVTTPNVPSIAPTGASVNTKSKFGIYTWNGHGSSNETLAHGLGAQPDFMICKKKSTGGNNWVIWHKSIGVTKYLMFTSSAADTDATLFNSHKNDSDNLWSLGTNNSISATGQSAVAYLWCDVPGLQKFGSYEGNESTDGTYVELGFRPAVVLVKNADEGPNDWKIYDGTRNPHNVVTQVLYPNLSNSEDANTGLDFLSNGFKLRDSGSAQNGAETIIYAAWAEAPSFNLYGGQSNAR